MRKQLRIYGLPETQYPLVFSFDPDRITQLHANGTEWRYTLLSELKDNLPQRGGEVCGTFLLYGGLTSGEALYEENVSIQTFNDGTIAIGCKHFTIPATRAIFKAAGINRRVGSKPVLKARAAAAKKKRR